MKTTLGSATWGGGPRKQLLVPPQRGGGPRKQLLVPPQRGGGPRKQLLVPPLGEGDHEVVEGVQATPTKEGNLQLIEHRLYRRRHNTICYYLAF